VLREAGLWLRFFSPVMAAFFFSRLWLRLLNSHNGKPVQGMVAGKRRALPHIFGG
jgi:hypothetical protein